MPSLAAGTVTVRQLESYFRTNRTAGSSTYWSGVDRNKNVIFGAKLIEEGPLVEGDSRNWFVDGQTLQQVVDFGSRKNRGLKARFAHPSMSDDGLGTFLGYWRNLRVVGQEPERFVVADLHLADSSFDTPKGDLGNYVLDLAEQDPEAFGVSVATLLADDMFDGPEDGDSESDDGSDGSDESDLDAPTALRIKGLHAADLVDTPAATRGGLFSSVQDATDIPAAATWLVERHFAQYSPEAVLAKAHRFLERHYGRKISMTKLSSEPAPVVEPDSPPVPDPVPATPPVETEPDPTPDPLPGPAAEPGQSAPPIPTPEAMRAALQPYRDEFGDELGVRYLLAGLSIPDGIRQERDALRVRVAALEADLSAARDNLAALKGEPLPLSPAPPVQQPGGTIASSIRRG
jgi:hypothetical protein